MQNKKKTDDNFTDVFHNRLQFLIPVDIEYDRHQ